MDAVALVRESGMANGRIAVLDQVDPLPFMLALEPPRGGNIWAGAGAPARLGRAISCRVDHVLIPKFTTNFAWTEHAKATYRRYLIEQVHHENRS